MKGLMSAYHQRVMGLMSVYHQRVIVMHYPYFWGALMPSAVNRDFDDGITAIRSFSLSLASFSFT